MPQCHAKSKRSQEQCKKDACIGRQVCHIHGGKTVKGVAHYRFKDGRYSRSLPTQVAARAQEALHNPRLLSLQDDLAVLEARKAQLMEQLETGGSKAAWEALLEARGAFRQARASGDVDGMEAHFAAMEAVMERGAGQEALWVAIEETAVKTSKLIQQEVKTLQSLQQMVTVQQNQLMLQALMSVVVESVREHTEAASARRILMDMQREFDRLSTLEER